MVAMNPAEALVLLRRGSVECHTDDDLKKKLASGRTLRIKLGVDPTSPDLHLGHTVQLNRLRAFQDQGHTAVLIIGDFTARVGDPSGRDSTRPSITPEQIKDNAKTYQDQAFKVLDPKKTEVRFNSEWLEPFMQKELFSALQRYTVGQLLQREDFSARSAKGLPITLLEILYPVFQGYDSVAIKSDVELGGNDQLFNLLMGRQMQKDWGQEPQVALTLPLLVGLDGTKKMSKSYGNHIGLTDSPRDMFGKVMRISDSMMMAYYELLTQESMSEIQSMHPMEAKKKLAGLVTARFHGEPAAAAEREFFDKTFSKKELPVAMELQQVNWVAPSWSQTIAKLGWLESRKEAQRLIAQGGFRVDGTPVKEDAISEAERGDLLKKECTLQLGKHKFYRVRFVP